MCVLSGSEAPVRSPNVVQWAAVEAISLIAGKMPVWIRDLTYRRSSGRVKETGGR